MEMKERYLEDNWFGAGNFCARLNMTLVMIETEEEEVAIVSHIRVNYGELVYWTAGNNLANNDVWVWEPTGMAITYFDWHQGEPNHMTGEHCINLDWANGYLAWNNENSNKAVNVICEQK
ncbi:hypothetical protein B566_EDAN007797 [Ephemera danica]|nr:hypothetical protein B566_EDAN007797 [Ephemera danica]